MEQFLMQTYTIALPVILTALMGYIVWLLKNQKKDRDANSKGTMLLLRVQLIEYHDRYMAKGDIPSYAYENFMETKANHMKEIEERRSGQVSERQTAEPATPISPKEAQAMGQKIKEKAEQEIAKAFNEMGFNCQAIRR